MFENYISSYGKNGEDCAEFEIESTGRFSDFV